MTLDGKIAVVTGGGSGIGRAIALRLAGDGADVAVLDLRGDAADRVAADVRSLGRRSVGIPVDVSDAGGVSVSEARVAAELGEATVLVNCAGIAGFSPLLDMAEADFDRMIAVHLKGTFHTCRAWLPGMLRTGWGRIVNVSSVAGKEGNPNASAYSASKAAVLGFTKSLAKELAGTGVLANAITPGTFESPILEQLPASQIEYMRSRIPMGRLGDVKESAAMICFMASEDCSFTTGATFDTSGGRTTY